MTDDGSGAAPASASMEGAADVGWEPPDWGAVLRGRRLRLWGGVAFLFLVALAVAPVVRLLLDQPPRVSWNWLALATITAGFASWSQFTATGRTHSEAQTRSEILIGHALRHHVSIGAANRELVDRRAEKIDSVGPLGLFGWPFLTGLFTVPLVTAADDLVVAIGFALLGLLACAVLLHRNRRRIGRARRWLADPLPRDADGR